ncbi:MAG: hypothetical protein JNM00_01100 [Flavobacteriales bacterium]|nr:hypothetical protein [Flavobacteriales bacterium]
MRTGISICITLLLAASAWCQPGRIKPWEWQFVGPDILPEDLNPGGSAIPGYAVNRGNGTGRINFLLVDPNNRNRVWACSPTGGLWYTTNEGEQWLPGGTDQLPVSGVSSVTIHPKKKKTWIISTGDGDDVFQYTDGIWRTRNAGKKWENINGGLRNHLLPFGGIDYNSYIGKVAASPVEFNVVVVASSKGLYLTRNAGAPVSRIRWEKIADGYFYDVEFVTEGKNFTVYAAGNKFYKGVENGTIWSTLPLPEFPSSEYPFLRLSIEVSQDAPGKIFAGVTCSEGITQSPAGDGTYQVFDIATERWEMVRSLRKDMSNLITTRARAIAVNPTDAQHVLTTNVQPIYYSHDGGRTFQKIDRGQMHDDVHHIEFSRDGKTVWAAHDGGVSYSVDNGLHWKKRDDGIGAANVFGLSVAQSETPQVLYGGYDTGGNLLYGGKWYHVSWGDGFETIIHQKNPEIMFATKQNGGIDKCTGQLNFNESANPSGTRTEWHTWIRQHPTNHNTIYCSGTRLVRSRDLGTNWESIFDCAAFGPQLKNVFRYYLSADHPGVMYLYVLTTSAEQPEIWRTFNVNAEDPLNITWEKLPDVPTMGWISALLPDPQDPHRFWLSFTRREFEGKVWYFNGTAYVDETRNLGSAFVESGIMTKGSSRRIYLGTNQGVFTRGWSDTSWTLLDGLPGTGIKSMDINYATRQLYVGTFGRGVWRGPLAE